MAIPLAKANRIAESLEDTFPDLKVEVKGSENEVIATSKKWTIHAGDLSTLQRIASGWSITFGRSGANFRMIIW